MISSATPMILDIIITRETEREREREDWRREEEVRWVVEESEL